MANRDDVIRKVQALWKLADDNGNTAEARSAAADKARDLMAKYQIDEIVLQEKQGKREAIVLKSIRITRDGKKAKFEDQRKALAAVIAREWRCRAVIQYKFESANVETGKKVAGGNFITVMGYDSDTKFVEDFYWMVVMQMLSAASDEQVQTENYQHNFSAGYVDRIDQRLREIHYRVDTLADGNNMALVLVDRTKAVDDAFSQMFPNLTHRKASKRWNYDPSAQERGRKAADNADLGQTRVDGRKEALESSRRELR